MRIENSIRNYLTPKTLTSIEEITLPPPQVPLSTIESTLREISPLFLGETPYDPSDSFITKCIKSILATLMLLSYIRQETRSLITFLPLAPKINAEVIAAKEHLEYRIFELYQIEMDVNFILRFEEEKLKVLKGESQEIPKEELLHIFVSSYIERIQIHEVSFKNGKKIFYNKEDQTQMIEEYKQHLENLFKQLNSQDPQQIEEVEKSVATFETLFEKIFDERCALAQTIGTLTLFLTSPLKA